MFHKIIITGATSGIGQATAKLFASRGYDIVACGRRADRLTELCKTITTTYQSQCLPLAFDIRNRQEVTAAFKQLPEAFQSFDILLNNAGLAMGYDLIQDADPNHWDTMIDTNVKGLLYVTRTLAPLLIRQGHGHIINTGSIAGKGVVPYTNIYSATKYAVNALTQAMRMDMLTSGIRVSQVSPGLVETEFASVRHQGNSEAIAGTYNRYQPLLPDDIAEIIYFIATRPAHVNINDLEVTPYAEANMEITLDKQPQANK